MCFETTGFHAIICFAKVMLLHKFVQLHIEVIFFKKLIKANQNMIPMDAKAERVETYFGIYKKKKNDHFTSGTAGKTHRRHRKLVPWVKEHPLERRVWGFNWNIAR